ncbi:MAG: hypothetical protein HYX63_14775 [Gammaproteobacteria bacterium]|nr:hypothetical protein [Gammaproteobacteria bacterium]
MRNISSRGASSEHGFALIVALVLLLVMTMIAVVAMRSTTLDLKMTTNTTLNRRAFQNSDGPRVAIGPALSYHVFYRGWPQSIPGGVVPNSTNFVIPPEVTVKDGSKLYYMGDNGVIKDLPAPDGDGLTPRAEDMHFFGNANQGGRNDMVSSIWVTRTGAALAGGSGAAQGSGYIGTGVGAAGADAHVFLDLRSTGSAAGNAQVRTGADFRVLIKN